MGDDQKVMKKRLKVLMNLPENQVCSDCTERQPRWASLIVPPPGAPQGSLPIGAFCCLECSGSHRRLGVHISFVRSINLDSWKEKEVLAMENGGNSKVNAIFEANLREQKPTNHADLNTRTRFIQDKYERRKFYDATVFERLAREAAAAPPPVAAAPPRPKQAAPAADEEDFPMMSSAARGFSAQESSGSVGAPSAAARRRLEARKIERSDTASSTQARAVAVAPPARGKGNADLLDFSGEPEPQRGVGRNKSQDLMGFSDDDGSTTARKVTRKKSMEMNSRRKSKSNNSSDEDDDEFAAMAAASGSSGSDFGDFGDFAAPAPTASAPAPAKKEAASSPKKSAQDIMSLYNASAAANPGLPNGMAMNNPLMAQMQQTMQQNQNMAQMQAKMQQMNMQNNPNMQSQQQVQQQAMMYQQHMLRLQMQVQQGMMGGNPMVGNGGMMGGGAMNLPSLNQARQPTSMTSDGRPGMGLASMHSVGSAASSNGGGGGGDADPFASLSGAKGFR